MTEIFGSVEGIRTVIFPKMVRVVRQQSFYDQKSLKSAVLNEGL